MRKLGILLISIASLFISVANAAFYFSFGGGATLGSVNTELTYPAGSSTPTNATYNYALAAFTPRMALGYKRAINKRWGWDALVSAEFNAGAAITKVNNWYPQPQINSYTNITMSEVYAIDILARYEMNAAVSSFIGPGIALGTFSSTSNVTGGVTGITGSYSKNLIGPQLMAGIDLFLTNTCTLRLSDQFTVFPTVKTSWVEPVTTTSFTGQYTLSVNTVMVEALFDF